MTGPGDNDDALRAERNRRLKNRNWAVLAVLIGFAVLIFVITIVKIIVLKSP